MPPVVAAGAALVAGAAAKTAVAGLAVSVFTKGVIIGALAGAVGGAVSAGLTGGNILKGALGGAVLGGITGGVAAKLGVLNVGKEVAGVTPEAGQSLAGAMAQAPTEGASLVAHTADTYGVKSVTNELFTNSSLGLAEGVGTNVTNTVIKQGAEEAARGGLTGGISKFWSGLGSEGKAAALQLTGGALKGVGEWQKNKAMQKMADQAHERKQITDVPQLQRETPPDFVAPHWERLNFQPASAYQAVDRV